MGRCFEKLFLFEFSLFELFAVFSTVAVDDTDCNVVVGAVVFADDFSVLVALDFKLI
jgi:hypothetical protein